MAFLLLFAGVCSPAHAQSVQERRQIAWTLERGRLLFALDRAAWVATDDMLERIAGARTMPIRGYVVEGDGRGFTVTFFLEEAGRPVALYRGQVGPRGVASRETFAEGLRPALTPLQQRIARAQGIARQLRLTNCGNGPMNVAVVPPAAPDAPIEAYVMSPQTDMARLPVGGHYRVTIDAEGRVANERPFTNSCLAMPVPPRGGSGPRPVGLVVNHLLDPLPTEIHVFSAMAAGLPFIVITGERAWRVTPDRIEPFQMPPRPR